MNFYIILIVLITLLAICALVYYGSASKLKEYKDKMDKAENIIETELNKKLDLIITLNSSIKKVTGKKDYLKDYVSIRDFIITNIEKDMKLDEATNLIKDLTTDYDELKKDKEFQKTMKDLKEIDEVLISAKNLFNNNAMVSNKLIKNFPYNVVAKIAKYRIRSFYNNKTDDNDNF